MASDDVFVFRGNNQPNGAQRMAAMASAGSPIAQAAAAAVPAPTSVQGPPPFVPAAPMHAGGKTADLQSGDAAGFPTWSFWGITNVVLTNVCPVEVIASIQVGAAAAQIITLAPQGQAGSIYPTAGGWAGFTLWVKNQTNQPSLLHVEVW